MLIDHLFSIYLFITILLTQIGILWLILGFLRPVSYSENKFPFDVPSLLIIVPCHNEERILPSLLETIDLLIWDKDKLQICFINDRSSDDTDRILREFTNTNPKKYVLLDIDSSEEIYSGSYKKRAIHKAIEAFPSEWIVTFDADSRPNPNWLMDMFNGYSSDWLCIVPSFRFIGGKGFFFFFRNLEALVQSFLMSSAIKLKNPLSAIGAGFCYKRDAFITVKGFQSHRELLSGDDDLLLHSISRLDGKIISKCSKTTTIDILDRDANSYWNARKRHYSVAKMYPFFWKFFGFLVIPGVFTPLFISILYLIQIQHFFSIELLLILTYTVIVELGIWLTVNRTSHTYQIWFTPFIIFLLPIWFIIIGILSLRPVFSWK